MSKPRVRFAPSPTGSLHLGGARTALYNYLFAKQSGGTFILRIEDTDQERSTPEALRCQLADLAWLGLTADEGMQTDLDSVGNYGPYQQSVRQDQYHQFAEQLLAKGKAYYCFLTDEEIAKQKEVAKATRSPYQVISPYRDLPIAEAEKNLRSGQAATVRFKMPEKETTYHFNDIVRGKIELPSSMVGDFVLIRSSGMPVYNFCCTIDDALMKITHVFRAEEHLSNTLRQLMLYEVFGWKPPEFGHLSIILGSDRKKLSKRRQAVSCGEFKEQGFLPQAILNAIALLGWTDPKGRDILSLDELIEAFRAQDLNASAAIFDQKKLEWTNQQHIRNLPEDQLWLLVAPFIQAAKLDLPQDPQWQQQALALFKNELVTLKDSVDYFSLLLGDLMLDDEAREVLTWPEAKAVLLLWQAQIKAHQGDRIDAQDLATYMDAIKTQAQVKGKHLFMPLRVALLGRAHGAELKLLIPLLDKQELAQRVAQALAVMAE